jgi:hypothetical protein
MQMTLRGHALLIFKGAANPVLIFKGGAHPLLIQRLF